MCFSTRAVSAIEAKRAGLVTRRALVKLAMLANLAVGFCATNGIDWYLIDMETGKEVCLRSLSVSRRPMARTLQSQIRGDEFGDIHLNLQVESGGRDIIHTGRYFSFRS